MWTGFMAKSASQLATVRRESTAGRPLERQMNANLNSIPSIARCHFQSARLGRQRSPLNRRLCCLKTLPERPTGRVKL